MTNKPAADEIEKQTATAYAVPFSFLRGFLRPIGQKFPAFKRLAVRIMDAEARRRAKRRKNSSPESMAEWLHFGHDQWLKHPTHHGKQTLLTSVPGSSLKFEDRLREETEALNSMQSPPKNNLEYNRILEVLRNENESWAIQIAALEDSLGYWDAVITTADYGRRVYYMRNLCLFTELYGDANEYPEAVKTIPEEYRAAFSMDGQITLGDGYINQCYPVKYADILSDNDLEMYAAMANSTAAAQGPAFTAFTTRSFANNGAMGRAVEQRLPDLLKGGRTVAVFGATSLYLEAACVRACATETTTIRFIPFINNTSTIKGLSLADWDASPSSYDLVLAINTVDTYGLGMHGEPLDADGDLKLMLRFRRMLQASGHLALSIPIGKDRVVFNSARIYGNVRLPRLLEGWNIVDSDEYHESQLEGKGIVRSLLILRPTEQ